MSDSASGAQALVARDLRKRYGRISALSGLDLEIPAGVTCGLVGPNGAGKTTAFAAFAGLVALDAGQVTLFGEGPFDPVRHAGRVSLMPQDSSPSSHATLAQSLRFYAELQGMTRAAARREADAWLDRVRLREQANRRPGELSHGMRRRLNLAQALMGQPELILLDEPTSGLDPELVAEMRDLLLERRGEATLIISSHVLKELEAVCDHVVFMDAGRRVRQGSMKSLRQASGRVKLVLEVEPDLPLLRERVPGVAFEWSAPELRATVDDSRTMAEHNARILGALLEAQVGVLHLEVGESLEAAYLKVRSQAGT